MKKINFKKPWIFALMTVTVCMLLIRLVFVVHYQGVDDTPTVQSFMGYEGGVPAHFHLYYHTLLAWALYGISCLIPGVAWVSVMQLFFLWLSNVVIVKSLMQCNRQSKRPFWQGALLSLGYIGAFSLYFYALPTYTTTGAMLGAAAVAQLLSINDDLPSQIVHGMLLSIGLLVCGYFLRQGGILPSLAFWGLGLLWLVWKSAAYRSFEKLKPFIRGCVVCALSFALLIGIRAVEIQVTQMDDYLKWQNARIELFDYTDFESTKRTEALERNGWSQEELQLVSEWYFMDENITTEAFENQREVQTSIGSDASGILGKLLHAVKTVKNYLWDEWEWLLTLGVMILAAALCVWTLLREHPKRPWQWLIVPCGLALGGALLIYLGWQGRINLRAFASVFLPMSAFVFTVLSASDLSPLTARTKTVRWVCTCALVAACLPCFVLHAQDVTDPKMTSAFVANRKAANQLADFARAHPDKLVIYSPLIVRDKSLFPDVSMGIPGNLTSWGNWGARTPSWMYQLSVFGIDGEHFTAADFLRENVVVVGTADEPPPALTAHIAEWTGSAIEALRVGEIGWYGFYQYKRVAQ